LFTKYVFQLFFGVADFSVAFVVRQFGQARVGGGMAADIHAFTCQLTQRGGVYEPIAAQRRMGQELGAAAEQAGYRENRGRKVVRAEDVPGEIMRSLDA